MGGRTCGQLFWLKLTILLENYTCCPIYNYLGTFIVVFVMSWWLTQCTHCTITCCYINTVSPRTARFFKVCKRQKHLRKSVLFKHLLFIFILVHLCERMVLSQKVPNFIIKPKNPLHYLRITFCLWISPLSFLISSFSFCYCWLCFSFLLTLKHARRLNELAYFQLCFEN